MFVLCCSVECLPFANQMDPMFVFLCEKACEVDCTNPRRVLIPNQKSDLVGSKVILDKNEYSFKLPPMETAFAL
jgi:hypothetical protein